MQVQFSLNNFSPKIRVKADPEPEKVKVESMAGNVTLIRFIDSLITQPKYSIRVVRLNSDFKVAFSASCVLPFVGKPSSTW